MSPEDRLAAALEFSPEMCSLNMGGLIGRGKLASSNAEQVAKIVRILAELGLEPATPDEARALLALTGRGKARFRWPAFSLQPRLPISSGRLRQHRHCRVTNLIDTIAPRWRREEASRCAAPGKYPVAGQSFSGA